jgi:hypothetical protein
MSKRILGIEVSSIYKDVAAGLAHMDNTEQAEFFGIFADELKDACGTTYHTEVQMLDVAKEMTLEQLDVFKILNSERQ